MVDPANTFLGMPKELADKFGEIIQRQHEFAQTLYLEADTRLSKHQFLANAGGAAATLAFIGAERGSSSAAVPLVLFLIAIMLISWKLRIESRGFALALKTLSSRRRQWHRGEIEIGDVMTLPEGSRPLADLAKNLSSAVDLLFAAGCVSGMSMILTALVA